MDIIKAGEPVILPTARILPEAREPLPEYVGPSNRVNAVGSAARSAVQDARNSGMDLPKNAQGLAASAIARGANAESVFSALIDGDATEGAGGTSATPDGAGPEGDPSAAEAPTAATTPAEPGAEAVTDPTPQDSPGLSAAETALEMLAEDPIA